jgi:hypothetical protein
VFHTISEENDRKHILEGLLAFHKLDGLSLQVSDVYKIHYDIKNWRDRAKENDRPWIIMMDEIGPWHTGTRTDEDDLKHDTLRNKVLWDTLMAGGARVEWYFGWLRSPNDLDAEDLRSRNNRCEQTAVAQEFYKQIPYTEMESMDELIDNSKDYCFAKEGEVYVVYLKTGGSTNLDLFVQTGDFEVMWYNPRTGRELQKGSKQTRQGDSEVNIGLYQMTWKRIGLCF